jgi:hypothetical protein
VQDAVHDRVPQVEVAVNSWGQVLKNKI